MLNGLQEMHINRRGQSRLTMGSLVAVLLAFGVLSFSPAAWAFQDGDEAADAEVEAPAADAGADDAGGGDTADTDSDTTGTSKSFLGWLIDASGFFGLVLLILSFVMVALIMMNTMSVSRKNLLPPAFIEAFEQKLTSKDYQGAYETARSDDSLVARVLAAGLSKLNRGYEEAVEGMQEVGEGENMSMEHSLSHLALIGSVAPMIGLMGTVYGMIQSFEEIANSATSPKPSELAGGISTALFTTLEGLTVAIPAMVFYSILRNRVARYVLEVGIVSEGLMARFSQAGKAQAQRPPQGGGAPQGAPAKPQQ